MRLRIGLGRWLLVLRIRRRNLSQPRRRHRCGRSRRLRLHIGLSHQQQVLRIRRYRSRGLRHSSWHLMSTLG